MDISGVDVDNLNDEEILSLCNDIVDCSNDEIFVLTGIDVNNLSDDEAQNLYDDIIYGIKEPVLNKAVPLTDKQILDNNYDIVDVDSEEILLVNGHNINLDYLTDDEILKLYNDTVDLDSQFIAEVYYTTSSCSNLTAVNLGGYYNTYWRQLNFNCYVNGQLFAYAAGSSGCSGTTYGGVLATSAAQGNILSDAFNGKGNCTYSGSTMRVTFSSYYSASQGTTYISESVQATITCYSYVYNASVTYYALMGHCQTK